MPGTMVPMTNLIETETRIIRINALREPSGSAVSEVVRDTAELNGFTVDSIPDGVELKVRVAPAIWYSADMPEDSSGVVYWCKTR